MYDNTSKILLFLLTVVPIELNVTPIGFLHLGFIKEVNMLILCLCFLLSHLN